MEERATGRARERRGRLREERPRGSVAKKTEREALGVTARRGRRPGWTVPQLAGDKEQLRGVRSGEQKGTRKTVTGKKRGRQRKMGRGAILHSVLADHPSRRSGDRVPFGVPGEIPSN